MLRYVLRRLGLALIVLTGVAFVTFGIMQILPGDYFTRLQLAAALNGLGDEWVESIRTQYGYHHPWYLQFFIWYKNMLLHGDLGFSVAHNASVASILFEPGGPAELSLLISGSAFMVAWLLAVPLGLLAATRWGRPLHYLLVLLTGPALALPPFLLAILVQVLMHRFINPLWYGKGLWGLCGWQYVGQPFTFAKLLSTLGHLLPMWLIIGLPAFVVSARVLRNAVLENLDEPYVTVARSKGISSGRLYVAHVLKNAVNPLIMTLSTLLPGILVAEMFVSPIFGVRTVSFLLKGAIERQNAELFGGITLLYAVVLILGFVLSDVLVALLDPRVRFASAEGGR